jgi:hypothetical protein
MNRKTNWALTPQDLKVAMIQIHLNHLHTVQLDMIDEVVDNSNLNEAKEVLSYIMEK